MIGVAAGRRNEQPAGDHGEASAMQRPRAITRNAPQLQARDQAYRTTHVCDFSTRIAYRAAVCAP